MQLGCSLLKPYLRRAKFTCRVAQKILKYLIYKIHMTILTLVIYHLIPTLRKQKQADIWEGSQPGLHNKSQGLQDYTVKYCLKK